MKMAKKKAFLGFLTKIASFHAFGIFIQDGPISMRLGFLSKMAAFQYVNYKNNRKNKRNIDLFEHGEEKCRWDNKPLGQPLGRNSLGQPLEFRSSLFRRLNHDEDDEWPPRALTSIQRCPSTPFPTCTYCTTW